MSDLANIKGLAQLKTFLDQLPAKLQKNVLRGALRAGAAVMLPVARQNIHSVSGRLAKSLKTGSRVQGDKVIGRLYTRDPVAHLVEYGTKAHTITAKNRKGLSVGGLFFQSVEHPGAQPKPFMRNAADMTYQAAAAAVAAYMKDRIETKGGLDTSSVMLEGDE